MSLRRVELSIVLSLLVGAGVASAEILVVDAGGGGDYLAIQPALDDAAAGDTVLVRAGTYVGSANQNLDFGGKDLLVRSESGPDATIIDGEGAGGGFDFHTGVTAAAVVEGFTLTGHGTGRALTFTAGDAPVISNCVLIHNNLLSGSGGSILIQASSPAFFGCIIAENSCSSHGGGVSIEGGAPTFTDCMFVGNLAEGRGGGLSIGLGADVALFRCTVTGNRADLADAAYRGGGLLVGGGASLSLERTIVWGNRAFQGDDLFAALGTTSNVICSDVDATGFSGAGQIVYGPDNLFGDPHFCQPAHCHEQPWTDGVYSLAANSPCLPANNSCGFLIGAGDEGCPAVVVWTGAAGTTAWEDPLNWSTLALPGPGDNVQLTMGNVLLSSHAQIGWITQCPENGAGRDTLRIAAGGVLQTGVGLEPSREIDQSDIFNDVGILDANAGAITPESEDKPWDWRGGSLFAMYGGLIQGVGGFDLEGSFQYLGEGLGLVGAPILNRGLGDGYPPPGVHVQSGTLHLDAEYIGEGPTVVAQSAELEVNALLAVRPGASLDVAGRLSNWGTVEVDGGATLALSGSFENRLEGALALTGHGTGGGTLTNYGLVQREGAGLSAFSAQIENLLDPATGQRGVVRVLTGALDTNSLANAGRVTVAEGAILSVTGTFNLEAYGLLSGGGTVDASHAMFVNQGTVAPGHSPGDLLFTGDYATTADSRLLVELGGTAPGDEYDQLQVDGTAVLGGALHVDVEDGFAPQLGDTFRIVTYTTPRLRSSPFDCMSGLQLSGSLYLAPVSLPNAFALVVRDSTVTNQSPAAMADTFWVFMNTMTVLSPLENDSDPDGDDLALARLNLVTAQGQAQIDPGGGTLTYWPPVGFAGEDSLLYGVTDCRGAIDWAQVVIVVRDPSRVDLEPTPWAARCLHAPAPNPACRGVYLTYDVPRIEDVRVAVYDLTGRQVQILARGSHEPGRHTATWFGDNVFGRAQPSGVYIVRLEMAGHTESRKLTLMR